MKLSIIIPVFNEKETILSILESIEKVDLKEIEKEIIIIDDGSSDGTVKILKNLENKYRIFYHEKNQGKGATIKQGFFLATGELVLIQDADLECNPKNYPYLLEPILKGSADVVFGSRFKNIEFHHFSLMFHFCNILMTQFSNFFTRLKLSDIWTGYKVFKIDIARKIAPVITAKRFEIEPELVAIVAKNKFRILEIPLTFLGKSRDKRRGKKFRIKDGFISLWYIIKFNLIK